MAPYLNETQHTASSNAQAPLFTVQSPNVTYSDDAIISKYVYRQTKVTKSSNGGYVATPKETAYDFKVERKVGKVGMMLVGWGGMYILTMITDWTLAHCI
jgi:myo-inositol-1-phosphate synthase